MFHFHRPIKMIKLINFDVVTKFHLGISKSVDIFLFHNEDMCDKYCVPNFILVHHLSKIMFNNLRDKKRCLTKYIYFFYVLLFLFLSLSNYYYYYRKWTNEISKPTCLISSGVLAVFPLSIFSWTFSLSKPSCEWE